MLRIPKTRKDGLPALRILKFLRLYKAAFSARRHALSIAVLARSNGDVEELKQKMLDDGPKVILEKTLPAAKSFAAAEP